MPEVVTLDALRPLTESPVVVNVRMAVHFFGLSAWRTRTVYFVNGSNFAIIFVLFVLINLKLFTGETFANSISYMSLEANLGALQATTTSCPFAIALVMRNGTGAALEAVIPTKV
jgi:hypothetical protein